MFAIVLNLESWTEGITLEALNMEYFFLLTGNMFV